MTRVVRVLKKTTKQHLCFQTDWNLLAGPGSGALRAALAPQQSVRSEVRLLATSCQGQGGCTTGDARRCLPSPLPLVLFLRLLSRFYNSLDERIDLYKDLLIKHTIVSALSKRREAIFRVENSLRGNKNAVLDSNVAVLMASKRSRTQGCKMSLSQVARVLELPAHRQLPVCGVALA